MSTLTFSDTHNMVAFLEKPAESDGFHEIIDFLNANQIHYALTVNPTIYTPCIEQFWATAKIKTVNGERQIQALVDKKKVIITESSIRSDLHLEDAGGTDCLPTATIFEELARMGYEKPSQKLTFYKAFFSPQWKFLIHTITQCLSAKTTAWNEFSSTMASAIICLATNQKFNLSKYIFDAMVKHLEGGVKFLMYPRFVQVFINQQLGDMSHHKKIYVNPSHTKKIFANMKREGKDFSGRVTPLFATMMVQANQEEGVDSGIPTASQQTPITIQPSTSKPQKKQSRRKQKKTTAVPHPSDSTADVPNEESVPTHSNDPLLSGEDRLKLTDLMDMCTKLSERVLDLEHTKTAQAQEITNLKLRVKKLEKKAGLRTHKFKRLYKVGVTRRVEYSDDESLGAQEDASKQGRSRIEAIDRDAEVTLVETQRRNDENDDNLMFDTGVFDGDEIVVETEEPVINAATTTKSIPVSTDEIDLAQEITLAQALAAMKSAKPKEKDVVQESSENVSTATTMVSTATTIVVATPAITTPPQQRAKGIAFREPVESTVTTTVPSQKSKDKGKAIMIEPEKPLKKKDQIELDEELAREIEAEEQAELERIQKEREKPT
ncbi:hypothetical protein Tco_0938296 [Tanacetum coccineum]|uniref:Uncharacterized protein n=1 Tax=Tanacetum coccineum TaxID=301880 RepID=A0ABQ5DJG1_9ASTR